MPLFSYLRRASNDIEEQEEVSPEQINVFDAAQIWISYDKNEEYMFGYSKEELEDAL